MTHTQAEIDLVLRLSAAGLTPAAIVRETAIPRSTVRDWLAHKLPSRPSPCWRCDLTIPVPEARYVHLLGAYLGDGYIAEHRRDVYRLVLVQDATYERLIREWMASMEAVLPNRVGVMRRPGCVAINSFSKHWPCLFPQHGRGRKHERDIRLDEWQSTLVRRHPKQLVRGLVESDGCRFVNRVVTRGKQYEYVRYSFTNVSADIRDLFCLGCDLLGVKWTRMNGKTIAVSRRADVALLDSFIGPKS